MAAPSAARATQCALCGKYACLGDCPRCPIRLRGECTEMYLVVRIGGVWRWVCAECYLKEHTKKG